MSFSGDLEHLPLIDIIQMLQQTGKSGTLRLTGARGECQLGFRDGFIVSANHVNTGFRVGSILVELGVITREALDLTLAEQALRGPHPPPLIALLVETGRVQRKEAYRGLQTVIELTIVEVLTWPKGRFELDVDQVLVSDEYRYFPDHNEPPPQVSTQNVLMEALRIFDEKKRDGTLQQESLRRRGRRRHPGRDHLRRRPRARRRGKPEAEAEAPGHDGRPRRASRGREPPPESPQGTGRLPRGGSGAARLVSPAARRAADARGWPCRGGRPRPRRDPVHPRSALQPRRHDQLRRQEHLRLRHRRTAGSRPHRRAVARQGPDVPVLVIDPPGEDPGPFSEESANATVQGIRGSYPALRFIRLVDPGQDDLALRALRAGALTALAKPGRPADPVRLRRGPSSASSRPSWPACSRRARLPAGFDSVISGSVSRGWAA